MKGVRGEDHAAVLPRGQIQGGYRAETGHQRAVCGGEEVRQHVMPLFSTAAPTHLLIAMTHASTLLKTSHSPSDAMMSSTSLLRRIS